MGIRTVAGSSPGRGLTRATVLSNQAPKVDVVPPMLRKAAIRPQDKSFAWIQIEFY